LLKPYSGFIDLITECGINMLNTYLMNNEKTSVITSVASWCVLFIVGLVYIGALFDIAPNVGS